MTECVYNFTRQKILLRIPHMNTNTETSKRSKKYIPLLTTSTQVVVVDMGVVVVVGVGVVAAELEKLRK